MKEQPSTYTLKSMQHKPISLLIVDDHPMVVEGLKTLLNDNETVEVRTHFANGQDTLDFLEKETEVVRLSNVEGEVAPEDKWGAGGNQSIQSLRVVEDANAEYHDQCVSSSDGRG